MITSTALTHHRESITLFISRDRAEREGNKAIKPGWTDFKVIAGYARWHDGTADHGFKVSMRDTRGYHVAYL